MSNDTEMIYVVHRSFQTRLGALATVPLSAHKSKDEAEKGSHDADQKVAALMASRIVTPDGQMLNIPLGKLLSNLGLMGIGHVAHGPIKVGTEESRIVRPRTSFVAPR